MQSKIYSGKRIEVCRSAQTNPNPRPLPVIDINLDISPKRKARMLLDTGAQISLINKNAIKNKDLINTENKITISSIHGSEKTLGEIAATIQKDNSKIPIQLQVTKNSFLKEDGIIGYDVIGENAIINGPTKTLTIFSNNSQVDFPISSHEQNSYTNLITVNNAIQELHEIEYLGYNEIYPNYNLNLKTVKSITHEINENKIRITPLKASTPIHKC